MSTRQQFAEEAFTFFAKLTLVFLLSLPYSVNSMADEPTTVRLWEGDAPGALGQEEKDIPLATIYLPAKSDKPSGAIVICPGGGYGGLAMDHEGHQIAQWANRNGLAGIVVSYRHRNRGYGHPAPMLDAQRAIRLVRHHAQEWNIAPDSIGIMGFSAGGHLTTTILTHFDAGQKAATDPIDHHSCRPDFGIVCYAVIAFGESFTHLGSQHNLLGKDAPLELVQSLSNEKHVVPETPPCFIWHTAEDKVVQAENSLRFASALVQQGIPVELHVFPDGRHGVGLAHDIPGTNQWPVLCENWLKKIGIVN